MKQTVLVTGATGFAGSHILMQLQSAGLEVIAACRNADRLPAGFSGATRIGDLLDAAYVEAMLDGVDVVCHAAAWPSLWGHNDEAETLYLKPTLNLLEQCKKSAVSRFVFLSTTSAASPDQSADAMSRGIKRPFWPYQCAVVEIEDAMRHAAGGTLKMVNLRCGLFVGERYGLGLLPILLPRLKTHLVPWISGGRTGMPLIDGSDIGRAFVAAARQDNLPDYAAFNIVGTEVPAAREVIAFLHQEFGYPQPHFSVPFPMGYAFAWLMEKLDAIVPWEPLVVRSIVHLLEETGATNDLATQQLGYRPQVHWRDSIRAQLAEMAGRQTRLMPMAAPIGR